MTGGDGGDGLQAGEREALLRKYRLLARWRRTKDASPDDRPAPGDHGAGPAAMRALADEFPGALRELDVLGLAELERRIARLAAPGGDEDAGAEPWMSWIVAYHRLMRIALATKRSAADGDARPPAASRDLDEAFLREIRRPPSGRLSLTVLQALGRRFDVPADDIAATLFPPRRAPR